LPRPTACRCVPPDEPAALRVGLPARTAVTLRNRSPGPMSAHDRPRQPDRGRRAGPAAGPDPLTPHPSRPVAPSGDRSPRRDIPPGRHLRVTPHAGGNPYRCPKSRPLGPGCPPPAPTGWVADRGDETQCSRSVPAGRGSGTSPAGMRSSRPTRGTPMWSGPRRSPVPVIAPAEEHPGSHLPPGPPRRRTDGTPTDHQVRGPHQCTRTCCKRSPASARRTCAGQHGNTPG
jgi:hypothetical protein